MKTDRVPHPARPATCALSLLLGLSLLGSGLTGPGLASQGPLAGRPAASIASGSRQEPTPGPASLLPPRTRLLLLGHDLQGASVMFGDLPGEEVSVDPDGHALQVFAPLWGMGTVPVVVRTAQGDSRAGQFTYLQGPVKPLVHLQTLSAEQGKPGEWITLTYSGDPNYAPVWQTPFEAPAVYFGDTPAGEVQPGEPGLLRVRVPDTAAGQLDVTLRCPLTACATLRVTEGLPFLSLP